MRTVLLYYVSLCLALSCCRCVSAEEFAGPTLLSPDASMGDTLRDLSSRAGVIFVGDIVTIDHEVSAEGDGFVNVVFHVSHSLRGALGSTYTMREWGGLWAAHQQRYRLGQRGVFFLHAPNAAGLSSPVDGMDGFVPLIPMGADAEPLLDARRLSTRILRTQETPLASLDADAMTLSEATSVLTAIEQSRPIEPILRPLPAGVRPPPVVPLDAPLNPLSGGSHVTR